MMPTPLRLVLCLLCAMVLDPRRAAAQSSCLFDTDCADANLCNGIERCVATQCQPGLPLDCDDGDPCTDDFCDPAAGCGHRDVACQAACGAGDDGERCSDSSACTVGDTCSGGSCVGTVLACDDAEPCTTDTCHAELGCVYTEQASPPGCTESCAFAADLTPCAADANPCTVDGCLEGACQVGLRQVVRQCADGDACNGEEFCSPIKGCEPGPPPTCDDGNACDGTESCSPATGCVPGIPLPDGSLCDDQRVCTIDDVCSAEACAGTPRSCDDADPSTTDLCTEATGCLNCVTLSSAQISLTFPAVPKPGKFRAKGKFFPAGPFDPTSAAGADVVLHDGPNVIQHSHVAGSTFESNTAGTAHTFRDRTGQLATGLQRLRIKIGTSGRPSSFSAKGFPSGTDFQGDTSNSVSLVAGPACATVTLPCELVRGGLMRRCRAPD